MNRCSRRRVVLAAAALAGLGLANQGYGASANWVGNTDGLWQTGTNWTGGSGAGGAAAAGDGLFFGAAGTAGAALTNNFAPGTSFAGLTFNGGASAFTIGGNSFSLAGDITDSAAGSQQLNTPMVLNGNRTVNLTDGGASLLLGGAISGTGFGLTKIGPGTLVLGAANTYTGTTTADGGTILFAADNAVSNLAFGAASSVPFSTNVTSLDATAANVTLGSLNVRLNTGTTNINNITIGSGKTLTVNGPVTIGPLTNLTGGTTAVTVVNVSGTGGTWNVNAGTANFEVGQFRDNAAAGTDPFARLDLTNLDNFSYVSTTGEFRVGYAGNLLGNLLLAKVGNLIKTPTLRVGDSFGNNTAGNSTVCTLSLGIGSNVINADTIIMGASKQKGAIVFQNASAGSVTITGTAGGASTANILLSNCSTGSAGTALCQLALAGHAATVQAGTVTVAELAGAGANSAIAAVTFDTGNFTASTIQLAVNSSGSLTTHAGTFTLGGAAPNTTATGVLTVNDHFYLANRTNALGPTAAGSFIINGGTANLNCDISDPSTIGTRSTNLLLNSGTLNMNGHAIGSAGSPITNVSLGIGGQTAQLLNLGGTGINGNGINVNGGATIILGGTNTYTGDTTVSSGTLALAPGVTIPNTSRFNVVSGANLDVTQVAGFTVPVGKTLMGGGNIFGLVNVAGTLAPGASAGVLTFNNGLRLTAATLNFELSNDPNSGNDAVNDLANLDLAGTSTLQLSALNGTFGTGTYVLMTYAAKTGGGNIALTPYNSRLSFTLNVGAGSTTLGVSGTTAALTWVGGGANVWDHSTNLFNNGVGPDHFLDFDSVTFNESGIGTNVGLIGALYANQISVDALTKDYIFTGTGSLSSGSLTKNNNTRLTLSNTGGNTLSSMTINGGTVTVLNTSNTGSIVLAGGTRLEIGNGGTGGDVGTALIQNDGEIDINRNNAYTFAANIGGGSGAVAYLGSGTTTVTGVNNYGGATTISLGTVRATNGSALGGGGDVTVASGAVLDVGSAAGAVNFGQKNFHLAGDGGGRGVLTNRDPADVNTGGPTQPSAFQKVILDANASIGGPGSAFDAPTVLGRIDIRGATAGAGLLDLNGHDLTKLGTSLLNLANVNVNNAGQIVVNAGALGLEAGTTVQTNGTNTIVFHDNTMLQLTAAAGTANITRPITMGDGLLASNTFISCAGANSSIGSNITLQGNLTVRAPVGNLANFDINLVGNVTEDATPRKIIKNSTGNLSLAGANTFTGGIDINTNVGTPPVIGQVPAGIVTVNSATALSPATVVSMAPAAGFYSVLRMNGQNVTLAGFQTTGLAGTSIIENGSGTATLSTLTVNNTANFTFAGTVTNASTLQLGAILGVTALTKGGTGTLNLTGNLTYTGGTTVNAGKLIAARFPNGSLTINGGTAQVSLKGTANSAAGTSVIPALSITPGGVLDLTNNSMVIDYSSVGTLVGDVRGHLKAGRMLTSAASPANTRLGYVDNATLATPKSSFAGVSVDPTSLLVKFTYSGDADLDGDADGVDIGTWATNFTGELGGGPTATRVWSQGDWDYDGDVDGVDAGLWATAFTGELGGNGLGSIVINDPTINPQAAAILQGMGITVVPEPITAAGVVASLAALECCRRRRRNSTSV